MSADPRDLGVLLEDVAPEPLDLASAALLRQVEVIGMREGGLIDCWVPSELIDHEEVPVKAEWATSLAKDMRKLARKTGGTGQLSPIIVGLIEGEDTLKIVDGFHRDAALEINGVDLRYTAVMRTDWDGLYDERILTAKDHAHVRFSRVVQWIREIWGRSGMADQLSVEQAVLLYRFDTSGTKLGLDPITVEAAKAWVERKEDQWQMAAMTIHSHLKVAEHVDPLLVHATREKKKGHTLEAPTQAILKIFSEFLPDRFDLQNLVMDAAMQHNLQGPAVKALCIRVAPSLTYRVAERTVQDIDPDMLKPEYHERTQRQHRRSHDPRHKGAAVLHKATSEVSDTLDRVTAALQKKEEVTEEMRVKVSDAYNEAEALLESVGTLLIKLADLKAVPAAKAAESSATAKTAEKAKSSTPPNPRSNSAARTTSTRSQAPPPPATRTSSARATSPPASKASSQSASSKATATATTKAATTQRPASAKSGTKAVFERERGGARQDPVHRVGSSIRDQAPVEGESAAATHFKRQIRDYLNGQSYDLPDFVTRSHALWAESMLAKERFSGDPRLADDVRELIEDARHGRSRR